MHVKMATDKKYLGKKLLKGECHDLPDELAERILGRGWASLDCEHAYADKPSEEDHEPHVDLPDDHEDEDAPMEHPHADCDHESMTVKELRAHGATGKNKAELVASLEEAHDEEE